MITFDSLLRERFGHSQLRPGQESAISALVEGRDVGVLMPTGGGKSLCYQLPALLRRSQGTTLVVSPLIALMNDQVTNLRNRGIAAAAIHSGQDYLEQRATVGDFLSGRLDLLYVSPERLVLPGFKNLLQKTRVAALAIDEAHCVSQWGHDFRREYMEIRHTRKLLNCPAIALTATATPWVLEEIITQLELKDPVLVRGSFARPNLTFEVQHLAKDAPRLEQLNRLIVDNTTASGRTLIYCATRKKVETVAAYLKSVGHKVSYYHAGRTDHARLTAQNQFGSGKTRILVATNAFGMGVDYPDIRLVAHFQTPASPEAYYQEAGRAGRDGNPARCVMFFGIADLVTQRFLHNLDSSTDNVRTRRENALQKMEEYARTTQCRQHYLCAYFHDTSANQACGQCDNCQGRSSQNQWFAPPIQAAPVVPAEANPQMQTVILEAVGRLRRPVGKVALAKALRGSHARVLKSKGLLELPQHGSLAEHSEESILVGIESLLSRGELTKKGKKYPTVWLKNRPVRQKKSTSKTRAVKPTLIRALEQFRNREARARNWKRYMVFTFDVIKQIEATRPDNLWALEQIRGIGPSKIERFGAQILELVKQHT